MSGYTNGPWHVGGADKATIYDKFGQRIGNAFEGVMVTQRSDYECQSNARLMACSPDLLEALDSALQALESISEEMTVGERYTNAGQYLIDSLPVVRAAIAKARGENA